MTCFEYCRQLSTGAEGNAVNPIIAALVGDHVSISVKNLPFLKRENKAFLVEKPALISLITLATYAGVLQIVVVAPVTNAESESFEEAWRKVLEQTARSPLGNTNEPGAPSVLDEQGLTGLVDDADTLFGVLVADGAGECNVISRHPKPGYVVTEVKAATRETRMSRTDGEQSQGEKNEEPSHFSEGGVWC